MLAWKAKIGHSGCTKCIYICLGHVCISPIIMKTESELFKRVAAEARTDELKSQLEKSLVQHS